MSSATEVGDYPPHASPQDRVWFDRVRREHPGPVPLDSAGFSAHVSALDLRTQTALLCDVLRRHPRQRTFIRTVESFELDSAAGRAPTLLIVPGAFYKQHRHTGADGQRLAELADEMGWQHERVSVESFGRLERNAALVLAHLERIQAESIVLASLSKGSAEVALALAHPSAERLFARVTGWVSLSGLVYGTPLVDWLRARRLRAAGVRLLLWARGQEFAVLDQLRRDARLVAAGQSQWPPHLRAIQVLGFPMPEHLRHRWAARAYRRLAPQGPNDGGGNLLIDALRWPGQVYPFWGADHYLNPQWNARSLLKNILCYAHQASPVASAASLSDSAPRSDGLPITS